VGSVAVGRYGKSEIPRATVRAVAGDIPVRVVATILRWDRLMLGRVEITPGR
jgi:hypothetical protein